MMDRIFCAFLVSIFLSACGGSSSDSATNADTEVACQPAINFSDPTAKAAGFYAGIFNNDTGAIGQDAFALFAPNGKIAIIAENELATGVAKLTNLPGVANAFNSNIDLWTTSTTKTRHSAASSSAQYGASLSINSGYSFDNTWDSNFRYVRPKLSTCLKNSTISDTWSNENNSLSFTFTQNNSAADFTGASSSGCTISGRLVSFDIEGGIFSVDARFDNCPESSENGDFSGLGALLSIDLDRADRMFLALSNEDSSKRIALAR